MFLEVNGRRVEVDDGFLSLTPDQQEATVNEIAASLSPKSGFMGQVNAGIAETAGGLVDFVNPFNDPYWQDKDYIPDALKGSATEGLKFGMKAINADIAEGEPETIIEGFARGTGRAAGAMVPATGIFNAMGQAPGVLGAFSREAARGMASVPGVVAETAAGGVSGAAREGAEQAGLPEWAQTTAEIAAPAVALPGVVRAAQGISKISPVRKVVNAGRRMATPMTRQGAEEVAAQRLRQLVGGEGRASELGKKISVDDELLRTPAQQTGDPNLMGLEKQAAIEDPNIRVGLEKQRKASSEAAKTALRDVAPGKREATEDFFKSVIETQKDNMAREVDSAMTAAKSQSERVATGPGRSQSSQNVVARLKAALADQQEVDRMNWAEVPKDTLVDTLGAKNVAEYWRAELTDVNADKIPGKVKQFLLDDGFADQVTAREMHELYSDLRQTARNALAGTSRQPKLANVANKVADAILDELEGVPNVKEALDFTRTMHETFDQGAVGRILRRTVNTDEQINPASALKKTVGVGAEDADAAATQIRAAADDTAADIENYLSQRARDAILKPDGTFDRSGGARWLRDNRELVSQFPALRAKIAGALKSQNAAVSFADDVAAQSKALDNSDLARFYSGENAKPVSQIISSRRPEARAAELARAASGDASGEAMAGLKASVLDELIEDGLSGNTLAAKMSDKRVSAAIRKILNPQETKRLTQIRDAMLDMDADAANVGEVMNTAPNKMLEYIVRIAAVKAGTPTQGGAGVSLQIANMKSSAAKRLLTRLSNEKARELLLDAVQDPHLFRELLLRPEAVKLNARTTKTFAPYLVGAGAAAAPNALKIELNDPMNAGVQ